MKKIYEAPELFVDEYVADTMIASSGEEPKNENADNNQNCWGCREFKGDIDGDNACVVFPGLGIPGC